MFQNKEDCPLMVRTNCPQKIQIFCEMVYQCYRTYVLDILQKKTYMYMYDMCGSKGVE